MCLSVSGIMQKLLGLIYETVEILTIGLFGANLCSLIQYF